LRLVWPFTFDRAAFASMQWSRQDAREEVRERRCERGGAREEVRERGGKRGGAREGWQGTG